MVARLGITAVAALSYSVLTVEFLRAYDLVGDRYRPNAESVLAFAPRYMDWTITVPLLTIELLAVCFLTGAAARGSQILAGAAAFLMIFFGFLGAFIIGGGEDTGQMILWGLVSCVFWIITNIVLIRGVRRSLGSLTPESAMLLRNATVLLLAGWVVYPLVYLIQIFTSGGGWVTTMQIVLCVTDVIVKIGFGTVIHRIAKLRTAEDVRTGDDVHPESIWISSVKQSDAGMPREVYLAQGAEIHPQRTKPPRTTAIAAPASEDQNVLDE